MREAIKHDVAPEATLRHQLLLELPGLGDTVDDERISAFLFLKNKKQKQKQRKVRGCREVCLLIQIGFRRY